MTNTIKVKRRTYLGSAGSLALSLSALKYIGSKKALSVSFDNFNTSGRFKPRNIESDNLITTFNNIQILSKNLDSTKNITLSFRVLIDGSEYKIKEHSIRLNSESDTITIGSLSVNLGNSSGPSIADASSIYAGIVISHPDVSKDSAYARLTEANTGVKNLSMFNSPIYHFTAEAIDKTDGTTGVEFPEIISDTTTTPINGPVYRSNQAGLPAVEYTSSNNQAHNFSPDNQLPTGSQSFSAVVTFYKKSDTESAAWHWGNNTDDSYNHMNLRANDVRHEYFFNDIPGGTMVNGEWKTAGAKYDGSTTTLFFDGSNVGSQNSGSVSVDDVDHSIGYRRSNNDRYADIYLYELAISDQVESDSAFQEYHNSRIP